MNKIYILIAILMVAVAISAQKPVVTPSVVITQKIISGSVLLTEKKMPDAKALVDGLKQAWKLKIDSVSTAEKTIVFNQGEFTVMIAWLDAPYEIMEIRAAARLSWLWPNADAEAPAHLSQMVISIIGTSNKVLEMNKLYTKVAGAILEKTDAKGVYFNSQYLLLSKDFYLVAAKNLVNEESLPLYCWAYFGMLGGDKTNSVYTYGLQEFGCPELEIVDSPYSLQQIHAVIYDLASHILSTKTTVKDGVIIKLDDGQSYKIDLSKGTNLEAETGKVTIL